MLVGLFGIGLMFTGLSQGALAASFSVSGTSYKATADNLNAQGVVQYGSVDQSANKAHPVLFNKWYRAELGKDGKDELTFHVPARMEVAFTLTHGMQGRLYVTAADGALKPVEVIAPQSTYAPPPPPPSPSWA